MQPDLGKPLSKASNGGFRVASARQSISGGSLRKQVNVKSSFPAAFLIRAAIAMDTMETTQKRVHRASVNPVKRAATNRAYMIFHGSNPFAIHYVKIGISL
jgi:hypothetical protein